MTYRPCVVCGEPSPESRCTEHQIPATAKPSAASRGYDSAWRRLSARARRLQPWCSDCGSTEDLTTDHSPEAWQRKAEGKSIPLELIDVVCRSCNAKRGRARPETWGDGVTSTRRDPRRQAKFVSENGSQ